jgi:uncharacterized glyoxalase superfamily protein PhnB
MYPYLSYRDAASALRFFEEAFGFATAGRCDAPYGAVQHADALEESEGRWVAVCR